MTKYFIAIFIILICIILFTPVCITAEIEGDKLKNTADIKIRYGTIKKHIRPSEKKKTEKEKFFSFEHQKANLEKYIHVFDAVKPHAAKILKRLTQKATVIEYIGINSEFGFDNAMHTGIFTGIYNGFVYSVLGFIHHNAVLKKMNVELQPVFDKVCFTWHVKCIARLKPVHIIIAAINVLEIIKTIKHEGSI